MLICAYNTHVTSFLERNIVLSRINVVSQRKVNVRVKTSQEERLVSCEYCFIGNIWLLCRSCSSVWPRWEWGSWLQRLITTPSMVRSSATAPFLREREPSLGETESSRCIHIHGAENVVWRKACISCYRISRYFACWKTSGLLIPAGDVVSGWPVLRAGRAKPYPQGRAAALHQACSCGQRARQVNHPCRYSAHNTHSY